MPIDCKSDLKIFVSIFIIWFFFVSALRCQNYHSFSFGGAGVETVSSIILSPETLITSGTFDQLFQWGDFILVPKGKRDFYIALTDLSGQPIHLLTGGSFREDDISNIIKQPNGNLIIGGTYWGGGYFLDTLLANTQNSKSAFLTAFSPEGIAIWRNFIVGSGGIELKSLALIDQKIYAAGTFENSLTIGDTVIYADYPENLWVAEFDGQGEFHKVIHFNATKNLTLIKMIPLPKGDLILGGHFNDSLIFPQDTLTANTLDEDIFILSLDTQLEINWYLKGGGVHRDALIDLVSNHENQIIATGDFVGRLIFSNEEELNSGDGIGDAFLVCFDHLGNSLWQKNLGGLNFQGTHALHTDTQSLIVCGSFESELLIENEIIATSADLERQVFLSFFDFNGTYEKVEIFQNSAQFFPSQIVGSGSNIGVTGSFANTLSIGNQSFESPSNYQAVVVNLNQAITSFYNQSKNIPTVHLFPNPANNWIQWDADLKVQKLLLYHISGQKIIEMKAPDNTIYLPFLSPGFYFLQLIDQKGMILSSTFIKN